MSAGHLRKERINLMKTIWDHIDYQEEYIKSLDLGLIKGFDQNFLEIESWMSRKVEPDENYPLVLVFNEEINQASFVLKFLEYEKALKKQNDDNYNIPIISSLPSQLQKTNYALYHIMLRLREHFNLKPPVPITETKLRKKFNFWLEMASKKLEKAVIFDSKINIIFESIEKQLENDPSKINLIKYWLPRTFPNRVNCIVTTMKGSKADLHFRNTKCRRIEILLDKQREDPSSCIGMSEMLYLKVFNEECFNEFNEKIAEIWRDDLDGFGESESASHTTSKDFVFTRMYFHLFLQRRLVAEKYQSEEDGNKKGGKVRIQTAGSKGRKKIGGGKSSAKKVSLKQVEKNLKMVNHFIMRVVKPDSIGLIHQKQEMINHVIERVASVTSRVSPENQVSKDTIINYFIYLSLTTTGITDEEIKKLTLMTSKQIKLLNLYFDPFLTKFNGLYKLIDEEFIRYTSQMYSDDQLEYFYRNIGDALEGLPESIRKIKEQTTSYIKAKEYFSVKQILSEIENFLVFFNSEHKMDLYNHWNIISKQSHDPVLVYNKSLELFVMHSQPSPNDLFRIVVQLSRFFLDMAEYEDQDIPEFRHPKILNRLLTVDKTKMSEFQYTKTKAQLEEEKEMEEENNLNQKKDNPFVKDSISSDESNYFIANDINLNPSDVSIDEKEESDLEKRGRRSKAKAENTINYLEDIGLLKEVKRLELYQKGNGYEDILNENYEKCNVDVPAGYGRYMMDFMEMITKLKTKTELLKKEDEGDYLFKVYNEEETRNRNFFEDAMVAHEKEQKKLESNDPADFFDLGEEINLAIAPKKERNFYYYKRWLWLIFPWACLSADKGYKYSDVIKTCYSNENKSMRVRDEQKMTRKALKICIEAKMRRKIILNSKKRDYLINPSSLKAEKMNRTTSTSFFRKRSAGAIGSGSDYNATERLNFNKNQHFAGKMNTKMKESMSMTQIKKDATTAANASQQEEATDPFFMTQPLKKRGSTLTEGPKPEKDRMFRSTLNDRLQTAKPPKGPAYFSNYDALISNKFKNTKYEKNIMKQYAAAKRRFNFHGMMKNIREAFELKSKKEVNIMQRKNGTFMKALNQIVFEKNKAKINLENLSKEFKELEKLALTYQENLKRREQFVEKRLKVAKKRYKKTIQQEKRLQKIIEICFINKDLNKEWIKQLQLFITNLDKMIKDQNQKIKRCEDEHEEMKNLERDTIKAYKEKLQNHREIISTYQDEGRTQNKYDGLFQQVDKIFPATDIIKPMDDLLPHEELQKKEREMEIEYNKSRAVSPERNANKVKNEYKASGILKNQKNCPDKIAEMKKMSLSKKRDMLRRLRTYLGLGSDLSLNELLKTDKMQNFLYKNKKNISMKYTVHEQRSKINDLREEIMHLEDRKEFFEFMKDEKNYQAKRDRLKTYDSVKEKDLVVSQQIYGKQSKMQAMMDKQTKNVTFLNSMIKMVGIYDKRDTIEGPYSKFDLIAFQEQLGNMKQECLKYLEASDLQMTLQRKKPVHEIVRELKLLYVKAQKSEEELIPSASK